MENRIWRYRYLEQGLHRTPKELGPLLQRQIDDVSAHAAEIVIGYGLCSNGIVGIRSGRQTLIIPRVHDCIGLFLGSPGAYRQAFKESPGTFYLTPAWVADRHDPLSIVEDLYTPRVGYDTAVWAMQEELKHYTRFTLILAGANDADSMRGRAQENAAFFDKEFQEIPGSLDYFQKLIEGPHTEEDFLFVPPGEQVTQEMFLRGLVSTCSRQGGEILDCRGGR